ncbi:phosphotransferase [Aliiglaciecola sp. LCG003]|uniref:aminoglycoside phosphotransferase family protein n=1 Tax=Aliiglaciecola sp. LCG003 TaxID=3053655 RepID=UPI0025736F14|nr:phosphotransferase [Aliiglaciecola sp. LCG003]WJG10189.1 phosphotransferase [Aliiglaciecola sp. LCG003]
MTQKLQREQALVEWINSDTPFRCQTLEMVSGDASFRRYFRFFDEQQQKHIICVDAPPEFENSQKFIDVALAYQQCGVNVPTIYAHSAHLGFYCQQDFGDQQFANTLSASNMQQLYQQALIQLPAVQQCVEINCESLPHYGTDLLAAEFYLFTHWLLEIHLGMALTDETKQMLDSSYASLIKTFEHQPQVGVHRDYHSRNLMIDADNQIGVIDFQDAVRGPLTYDLVSLLRDCYVKWPQQAIEQLLQWYHQEYCSHYEWNEFSRWFDLTGVQRHIKASGIFCRLYHRDGKQGYLKDIPRTLEYIIEVSRRYPELTEFGNFVADVVKPKVESSIS